MIPLIAHCLGLVHLKVVVVPFPYHCAVFACKKAKKCIHFILFSTKNGLHLFKDFKRNSVGKYGTNACVAWACTFVVESTNEDNLVWEQRRWLSVKIRWHVQQQFVTSQNTTVVLLDAVFLPLIHCFKLTDAATFTLLLEPQKNRTVVKKDDALGWGGMKKQNDTRTPVRVQPTHAWKGLCVQTLSVVQTGPCAHMLSTRWVHMSFIPTSRLEEKNPHVFIAL